MGNRFSPGCKCCGCTADANSICLCSCTTPYPKSCTTADDLGSHVLTWNGSAWTGTATATGVDTFQVQAFTGDCINEAFIDLTVRYSLLFNCTTGMWTLTVNFPTIVCGGAQHYGDPAHGGAVMTVPPQDSVAISCDPTDIISFNIPTTTSAGLAVLGGGGAISVVF